MPAELPPRSHASRLERLRIRMEEEKLSALLVTSLTNIFYLTGFRGSAGTAVVDASGVTLWVDSRYTLQAKEQAPEAEVIEAQGIQKAAVVWLKKKRFQRVGYEPAHLTCAEFQHLTHEARGRVRFQPAGEWIEELRQTKDDEEIACIREAGRVTVEVLQETLRFAKPGIREADLAAEIEYRMRMRGAEGAAFESIVASGPRGAFPHARASSKLLEKDELVIFDLGAIVRAYAADMTRTVFIGNPNRRIRNLYKAVLEAQGQAVEALRDGVKAEDIDTAARRVLKAHGVAQFFTHSTGHGVGLEIHERPRLAKGQKARLRVGCVLTAEPGIYLEGLGGIRIEDTLLLGPNGAENLTPAPKEPWVIV